MATVALKSAEGKWIMVSAILASAMAFIDSTALNVVLPSLQKSLNATGNRSLLAAKRVSADACITDIGRRFIGR